MKPEGMKGEEKTKKQREQGMEKIRKFWEGFDRKYFFRRFVIDLVVLTIVLIPVHVALDRLGNMRLFAGDDSLEEDMNSIVDPDSPFYEDFKSSKRVNILMLGVNDGMTDVMMLGSYDLRNQRVDIISVPRDTYYYRSNYKSAAAQKINSIYHTEDVVKTAEAVSEVLLGIPINYYVVVNYDAVRAIVDEMGGVPVNIPFTMKYDDPYDTPPLHIYFEEGPTVLSGDDAVKYLRYRKGYKTGDIGRISAHQEFVKAAVRRTLEHGPVAVAKVAFREIESDLPLNMLLTLARKAAGLDSENVYTWMVPGHSGMANGASYWYADLKKTEQMIDEIYHFEDYEAENAENEEAGEAGGGKSKSASGA